VAFVGRQAAASRIIQQQQFVAGVDERMEAFGQHR